MDEAAIKERLLALEFVYMFLVGVSTPKDERYVDGHKVWCDYYFTAVIQQKGKGVALIGFRLSEETLFVGQLQGIRGVNVKCNELGEVLLQYAEIMARTLDRRIVCVLPAHRNLYWDLDESHSLYPQLYKHQNRLKRTYDASARKRGYEPPMFGYQWWSREIRKRLSFARFLRLKVLLFDRSAKRKMEFIREFQPTD